MATRSESTGGLKTATAAFQNHGQESPPWRLLTHNTIYGFVEWQVRLATTHDIPSTTEDLCVTENGRNPRSHGES